MEEEKASSVSQLIIRSIIRIFLDDHKSCVDQASPDDWCEKSMEEAKEMREAFKEEKTDAVANADQKFVNFNPKSEHVLAPRITKCVGNSIKPRKNRDLMQRQ